MNERFNPSEHFIQLKGKDYLQVAWRLVWFREEHPDWCIDTQMVSYDAESKHAIFRATVSDKDGIQKSCGFGSESARDFGDFIEKAETKAVGRALAMLGYGTQFCADELDEGERIVDSPIDRKPKRCSTPQPPQKPAEARQSAPTQKPTNTQQKPQTPPNDANDDVQCENCGTYIIGTTTKKAFYTPKQLAALSVSKYGKIYCEKCAALAKKGEISA